MRKIIASVGLALAVLWSAPASAFDTPSQDASVKERIGLKGTAYQRYATALGHTEFAWGNLTANGAMYTLKYLPPKETLATAKSMVVITVYGLSGDKDEDEAKMARTISMLQGIYTKSSTMVDNKIVPNPLEEKTWFTQFYYGDPPTYVAGSYLRTNTKPSEAAFIQLQSRSAIPPEKALMIYQLVNSQAELPPKPKKPDLSPKPLTPEPVSIAK